ncbi:MAG: hypothetical protein WC423_17415 [Vulcanimicrobiota bacterium]
MTKEQRRELTRLEKSLREWRAKHHRPTPIPDEVWSGAAGLANQLGVGQVARTLRLDHGKLKRLTEGPVTATATVTTKPLSPVATFVEFQAAQFTQPPSTLSCALEIESASGGMMRARLEAVSPSDLGTVFRMFGG